MSEPTAETYEDLETKVHNVDDALTTLAKQVEDNEWTDMDELAREILFVRNFYCRRTR